MIAGETASYNCAQPRELGAFASKAKTGRRGKYRKLDETEIGDPPCIECKNFSVCESGFACDLFRLWCHEGTINEDLGRVPSRRIYESLCRDRLART